MPATIGEIARVADDVQRDAVLLQLRDLVRLPDALEQHILHLFEKRRERVVDMEQRGARRYRAEPVEAEGEQAFS